MLDVIRFSLEICPRTGAQGGLLAMGKGVGREGTLHIFWPKVLSSRIKSYDFTNYPWPACDNTDFGCTSVPFDQTLIVMIREFTRFVRDLSKTFGGGNS